MLLRELGTSSGTFPLPEPISTSSMGRLPAKPPNIAQPRNKTVWSSRSNVCTQFNPAPALRSHNNMPATPYDASPCGVTSFPASPYIATTPSQQQLLTTKSKAQKDQERQKTIYCLENKAKHDFDKLELPDVIPSNLREQLYAKFRESTSPKDFVDRVEKVLKASLKHLPSGFELDNDSKETIRRIPSQISLDYIIEQRTEADGLVDKAKPTGWEAIAKVLKDAIGFSYSKTSCRIYYEDWMKKQRNQSLHEQSRKRPVSESSPQDRRPHSPDEDVPFKTPRYSESHLSPGNFKTPNHAEAHMSPGQCSAQSEHSSLVPAMVENTVISYSASGNSASSMSSLIALLAPGSRSQQTHFDSIKNIMAQREQILWETLQSEKEQMIRERQQIEKEKKGFEDQLRSVQDTSQRVAIANKEHIAKLESKNAALTTCIAQHQHQNSENTSRIALLESEGAAKAARIDQLELENSIKSRLQCDLDAAVKEIHKLSADIEKHNMQRYTKTTIQPIQLNCKPGYGFVGPPLGSTTQLSDNPESDPMLCGVDDSPWSSQSLLNEFDQFKESGISRDSVFFSDSGSASS